MPFLRIINHGIERLYIAKETSDSKNVFTMSTHKS